MYLFALSVGHANVVNDRNDLCVFFIRLHILIICAQEVITFSIESLECFPMPLSSDINNLLLVGHTHDDIDRFFSRLHVEIAGRVYYTVARIYNTKVGIMIQTLITLLLRQRSTLNT